jgi:CubicO group peptidase (beta-lactamase class C family)
MCETCDLYVASPTNSWPMPWLHDPGWIGQCGLGGRVLSTLEPGTRWRYADHGFATLGQIVEDVSGKPLARYLREHIFEPLGWPDTYLVRSEPVQSRLATGYSLRSGNVKLVTDYEMVTA